jgi:hypothetical protein
MKPSLLRQLLSFIMGSMILACTHEAIPEPGGGGGGGGGGGTGSTPVCFETEVLPIFQSACAKSGCHDARSAKEGYVLDSYANIIKRGITPGRATNSEIYRVLFKSGDDRMPEPPNPPLSMAQSDAIGRWINEGALNTTNCSSSCDTTVFSFSAGVNPILQNNCVGCHNPSSLNGGVNLGNYASVKVYADNGKLYGSMAHLPGFKPMPQGGSKLSSCQLRIVEKWILSGAPNN